MSCITFFIESLDLCLGSDMNRSQSLLLITFGSGQEQYSNKTPCDFDFATDYQQEVFSEISQGTFGFVNRIPDDFQSGHKRQWDHTLNSGTGYMYLVNVGNRNQIIVNTTVNNLSVGVRYEYSAYLANIIHALNVLSNDPEILFEVRNATSSKELIDQFTTGGIPKHWELTWKKYNVSFVATTNSVILLMKSCVEGNFGNDIAIDDIELRACSNDSRQHHNAS